MTNESLNISIISTIIRKAIKPLTRDYSEIIYLQSSHNGTNNFASKARTRVEGILAHELSFTRGEYPIIDCSNTENHDSEYRWLIDPIDGMQNFSHSIPFFVTSLALQKKINGEFETIVAIIEAPALEEYYVAEKGTGAWLDNYSKFSKGKMRMRVSKREKLEEKIIISNKQQSLNLGSKLLQMAFVAAGKIDSYSIDNFNPYQASIAKLFISEAGGKFTTTNNNTTASN